MYGKVCAMRQGTPALSEQSNSDIIYRAFKPVPGLLIPFSAM